jgi:hypothetical protein
MSKSEGQFILIIALVNSFLILTSLGIDIARLNISLLFIRTIESKAISDSSKTRECQAGELCSR